MALPGVATEALDPALGGHLLEFYLLVVLAFTLVGDWLRDALDPSLGHASRHRPGRLA